MARKREYQKKPFESTGERSDVSANIYMSMLMSPAFQALSSQQQILYVYCKAQYYGERTKPRTEAAPAGNPLHFTMNRAKWCNRYHLYKDNNRASFYRDMNALIEKGFIRCVQSGKTNRTKSVYAFSDEWQRWQGDPAGPSQIAMEMRE